MAGVRSGEAVRSPYRNKTGDQVERVQGLVKGLKVLQSFGRERVQMTLAELARATGLPRATARRLAFTLIDLGLMETDGKYFRLTPNVLSIGYSFLATLPWWEIAGPLMQDIVDEMNETCVASILSGNEIVIIARRTGTRFTAINPPIGGRMPAHASSMGKLLLASRPASYFNTYLETTDLKALTPRTIIDPETLRQEIEQARSNVYAMADEEYEQGLRSIAVPLTDTTGFVLAALAVSGHASRLSVAHLKEKALPLLRSASEQLRSALPTVYHAR